MPNWCGNKLTVLGRAKDVAEFVEAEKKHFEPDDDEPNYPCFFSAVWGPAFFLVHQEKTSTPNRAEFTFGTKWSPRTDLHGLSARYPKLAFCLSYRGDPNDPFYGGEAWMAGRRIEQRGESSNVMRTHRSWAQGVCKRAIGPKWRIERMDWFAEGTAAADLDVAAEEE